MARDFHGGNGRAKYIGNYVSEIAREIYRKLCFGNSAEKQFRYSVKNSVENSAVLVFRKLRGKIVVENSAVLVFRK